MILSNFFQISDRVIVDAGAYYELQREDPPTLKTFSSLETTGDIVEETTKIGQRDSDLRSSVRTEDLPALTDEQCLIAVTTVKGFVLNRKEWCKFTLVVFHTYKF
jgi:hypothetical protein